MVSDQDFNKQFANIGIDKESIMNANKPNSLHNTVQPRDNNPKRPNPQPVQQEESQEIMLLKRKMDYLQNTIMAKFNEKFEELEKKIDAKSNTNVDYNRQMTSLKNDIEEVKRKIKCIRVVFTDEPVAQSQSSSSMETSSSQVSSQPVNSRPAPAQSSGQGQGNPGNIRVEDYFNFSNKKFD